LSNWSVEAAAAAVGKVQFAQVGSGFGNQISNVYHGSNGSFRFVTQLASNVNTGGTFTYSFYTESGDNTKIVDAKATRKASTTNARIDTVTVSLPTGNRPVTGTLNVVVGYVTGIVIDNTVDKTPVFTPEEFPENVGKVDDNKPTQINSNPTPNEKEVIVPGGVVRDQATVLPAAAQILAQGDLVTLRITFTGPLANFISHLDVNNVLVNASVIKIVYVFDNSARTIFGVRSTTLRDAQTESWVEFDSTTGTLYVHLVNVDVDAVGNGDNYITSWIIPAGEEGKPDESKTEALAQFPIAVEVAEHPVYLLPDNGVPSLGYAGYFTLGGTYPTDGRLVYRLQNDNEYKSYFPKTGLLNSEIARLANGELLYFSIKGLEEAVGGVYIYYPKTYDNAAGGGDVNVPQLARNVSVHAAANSQLSFAPATTGGQWISTTDGFFSFIVTPETVVDGYELTFSFYKDWITVANKPVATYDLSEDGTYYIVSLSNIKVSDLQIVVAYGQATGNGNVDADKVWTNNGTLFINSATNGIAKVYSITGGLVKSVKVEANTLTTTELPAGVYIVTLNGKSTKVNTK
jgi:hypothetical protein